MIATLVAKVISLKKTLVMWGVKLGHCHTALYNDLSILENFNYFIFLNIDFQHFAFLASYLSSFFMFFFNYFLVNLL